MTDLLSRLSAATGPSRELDAEICPYPTQLWEGDINDWLYEVPGHEGRAWDRVPRYTESIDAAMTLVPEGKRWEIWGGGQAPFRGEVWTLSDIAAREVGYSDVNPALALVIACLKARMEKDNAGQ